VVKVAAITTAATRQGCIQSICQEHAVSALPLVGVLWELICSGQFLHRLTPLHGACLGVAGVDNHDSFYILVLELCISVTVRVAPTQADGGMRYLALRAMHDVSGGAVALLVERPVPVHQGAKMCCSVGMWV
jgi:hypothetical protein